MSIKLSSILENMEKKYSFRYSTDGYGRCYNTLYFALRRAMEKKIVSVILTKNKKQFYPIINEISNMTKKGLEIEIFKDRYNIFYEDTLLVIITEDRGVLNE